MSKAEEFKAWCQARTGHPPQVKLALDAILELEARLQSLEKVSAGEKAPITPESVKAVMDYLDEGEPDLNVVKGELGELIARHDGSYCSTEGVSLEQVTSRDYDRLFDLVFNHGFDVPCCLDYSFRDSDHVFTDYAVVRKRGDGVSVGVRGTTYSSADEFQVGLSKSFTSVKAMFKRDCERDNLQWFDTFTHVE